MTTTIDSIRETLEAAIAALPTLPPDEQIDLAARIHALKKNCDTITDWVKDRIKARYPDLTSKDGPVFVTGQEYKAKYLFFPVERLEVQRFKAERPGIYTKYASTRDECRITFHTR